MLLNPSEYTVHTTDAPVGSLCTAQLQTVSVNGCISILFSCLLNFIT